MLEQRYMMLSIKDRLKEVLQSDWLQKVIFDVNIFPSGEFDFVQQFRTIMNGNPDAIALNIMLLQLVVNISLHRRKTLSMALPSFMQVYFI